MAVYDKVYYIPRDVYSFWAHELGGKLPVFDDMGQHIDEFGAPVILMIRGHRFLPEDCILARDEKARRQMTDMIQVVKQEISEGFRKLIKDLIQAFRDREFEKAENISVRLQALANRAVSLEDMGKNILDIQDEVKRWVGEG